MSVRPDRDTRSVRRRWVHTHEAEWITIGIPREVWADRLDWWRFVEHGCHPPAGNARDVRFSVDDLAADRRRRPHRFLDSVLPELRVGFSLWAELQGRFGTTADNDSTNRSSS